ncbi:conjugal transfer protein [Listeria booriae]|uniref:Conjugal transfer protein n=1 Tax=Listeria booriae TaxID=1552123 RepID=A0A7X0WGP8_9LIST|nr:conjugal transfer protein [Listeria booriae]MBC1333539.1 conjugal transfer protein [Listeria booriae]
MNEPKIHLENIHPSAPKPSKRKKKTKKTKQVETSSRKIPFKKRSYQNGLTIFFYGFFVVVIFMVIMILGRLDTIVSVANEKAIDPSKLVAEMKAGEAASDMVVYEGEQWLATYFTSPANNELAMTQRKEQLEGHIAEGIRIDGVEGPTDGVQQQIKSVSYIHQEVAGKQGKEVMYRTLYDVVMLENQKQKTLQIALYGLYKDGQFLLVQLPEYLNTAKSTTPDRNVQNPEAYFVKDGNEIEDGKEKGNIELFIQKYLELYCKNDANLYLVSAVRGLDQATLEGATINQLVKKNGVIYVQGTYSFSYTKGATHSSYFSLEMRQNKDSYFVEKMNE